jgi:glyoxylase-like metal-dependent hydrolase (beta-lactamase superfamily II)
MKYAKALTLLAAVSIAIVSGVSRTAVVSGFSQTQSAPAPTSIKHYVFDGGVLGSDPARYRLTKEDVGTTDLSVAAYLIVHPKGVLLWDTGAVPDESWSPTGSPIEQRLVLPDGQERRVTIRNSLKAQLKASGYTPAQVTHLALSHYHWDHTANANAFARATWLVRQIERDTMFADKPLGTATPMTYSALKTSKTIIETADEHDVFGDGAVILKSAPGHTPGHQVLYVKLAKTGGVVLSGDLYHYPQERTMNRLPTFEFNEEQTRAARKSVEEFLTRTKSQLWIQHDFNAHAKLKKAPEFYN